MGFIEDWEVENAEPVASRRDLDNSQLPEYIRPAATDRTSREVSSRSDPSRYKAMPLPELEDTQRVIRGVESWSPPKRAEVLRVLQTARVAAMYAMRYAGGDHTIKGDAAYDSAIQILMEPWGSSLIHEDEAGYMAESIANALMSQYAKEEKFGYEQADALGLATSKNSPPSRTMPLPSLRQAMILEGPTSA